MISNVLEYLESSALKFPDRTAFADESQSCTYAELKTNAQAVASRLAELTEPGKPIPVFMEKGVPAIYAFMGIVYAGGFYVLLDPKMPKERIQIILRTLNPQVLLTEETYVNRCSKLEFSGTVLDIKEALDTRIQEDVLYWIRQTARDVDPLYTIFTSGSTGVPKGVVVSHRSVIDFIEVFTEMFHITEADIIGNQAPFDFDVSVKDIYSTLKTGATMQIIPKKYFSFPAKLLDYLEERGVTTLIWAVSALCMITSLKGFAYKVPGKVNKVIFSGEVMPVKHLNEWRKHLPDALFVNVYGPTEITCNCTYYVIDREYKAGENIPIGRPFPNEKVFLLDEEDREIKVPGKIGELCVSGTALSLGYYHNPEQTEKVFVQNPLNPFYLERIYRTGDLAYYGEDGMLYFASRKDFQIKHMGHRIELGEIEKAIERVEGINRNLCIYDEEKNKIIAYYDGDISKKVIVQKLADIIPSYMIPNIFISINEFPVTKNGKIDRKRLMEEYKEERNG